MDDDALREPVLYFGGSVKALGDGRVGGHLVRFTTPDDPDLTGEFFTKDTDFGGIDYSAVYYNHGADPKLGKRRLGNATLKADEFGVWAETQLQLRDEYERFIYNLAEQGKMGWSSGTAPHLVEYEQAGKATWIKSWPLGLDASLTPAPAEPRNSVIPLKSYLSELQQQKPHEPQGEPQGAGEAQASDGRGADATKSTNVSVKEIKMEEVKNPQPVAPTVDIEAIVRETAEKGYQAGLEDAKKAWQAAQPIVDRSGYSDVTVTGDETDRFLASPEGAFKSFGEQLQAVYLAGLPGRQAATDNRLVAMQKKQSALKQTGMSEGVPADGGFLVQQDFASELFKLAHSDGEFLTRVKKVPIGPTANGLIMNAIAETNRGTGTRWGGMQGYWLAEAGVKTPSHPTFRRMEWNLRKLAVLCWATDELLQDTVALGSIITQAASEEIRWLTEEAIMNGLGGGQPVGIMGHPSLVTVPAEPLQAPTTIVFENILNMYARRWSGSWSNMVWFINQDIEPQLLALNAAVGAGGQMVYMPPGGISQAPYATLYGKPVIPSEHTATLGTTGDICLFDLGQYLLIDKGGVQAASSIHVNFVYDETCFRFVYRVDGQPLWNAQLTPANSALTQSPFVVLAGRP